MKYVRFVKTDHVKKKKKKKKLRATYVQQLSRKKNQKWFENNISKCSHQQKVLSVVQMIRHVFNLYLVVHANINSALVLLSAANEDITNNSLQ